MSPNTFYNIVIDTLFVIGLWGLIGGNLTVTQDLPIKNRQARVVGLILLLPLLSVIFGFTHWWDLLPTVIGIAVAIVYLCWTTLSSEPKVYLFWLAAILPALCHYIIDNSAILWNSIWDFSITLPLRGVMFKYAPFFIIEIFVPFVTALLVILLIPIAKNKTTSLFFAVPVLLFHIHYSVLFWFPFHALEAPGGSLTLEISKYFIADIVAGLFLFGGVACTAWLIPNKKTKFSKITAVEL